MPSLRDRKTLVAPKSFNIWEEGDKHALMSVRRKKSENKAKRKSLNKKYGEIRKAKKEVGSTSSKPQSISLKENLNLKKKGIPGKKFVLREKENRPELVLTEKKKKTGKLAVKLNFKKT